jgi:membrane-associated phospholipid phosphatase
MWRAPHHLGMLAQPVHGSSRTQRTPSPLSRALYCSVALVACWLSATARAADSPYRLYPALDATTLGVSAAVWWVPSLFPGSFVAADGCECRAASVNALDRPVAGVYNAGFSITGEVLIASLYTGAIVLDFLQVLNADEPTSDFLIDIAVMAEAVLLNGAVNQIVKLAVTRPRPLLYETEPNDPVQSRPDSYLSFYSAHASSAFALALAYAQTFSYRHPESPYRYLVYAGAVAAGSLIGASRIAAGKHFPSDVLVGAAVGSAFGLLIPWLHRERSSAQLSVAATPHSFGITLAFSNL